MKCEVGGLGLYRESASFNVNQLCRRREMWFLAGQDVVFQSDHFSLYSHDSWGSTSAGLWRPMMVFQALYIYFSTSAAILCLFITSWKQLDKVQIESMAALVQRSILTPLLFVCQCLWMNTLLHCTSFKDKSGCCMKGSRSMCEIKLLPSNRKKKKSNLPAMYSHLFLLSATFVSNVTGTVRSGRVSRGSDTTGAPSVFGDVTNQLAAQERTLCAHAGKCLTNNHNRTACDENTPQKNTDDNVLGNI